MRAEQWVRATAVYSSKSRLIYCSDSIDKSAVFDWTFRSLFSAHGKLSQEIIFQIYHHRSSILYAFQGGGMCARLVSWPSVVTLTYMQQLGANHICALTLAVFTAGVFQREHLSWAIHPILSDENRRLFCACGSLVCVKVHH